MGMRYFKIQKKPVAFYWVTEWHGFKAQGSIGVSSLVDDSNENEIIPF